MKRIFGRVSGVLLLGLSLVVSSAMIGCGGTTTVDGNWTRMLGLNSVVESKIAVDSRGNSYLLVRYLQSNDNAPGTFVFKYKPNGEMEWKNKIEGALGYGINIDSVGNCYITGGTEFDLDLQHKKGAMDIFVIKYNSNGVKQQTKLICEGDANTEAIASGIVVDDAGNFYITGSIGKTLSVEKNVFTMKYNKNFEKEWVEQRGVTGKTTIGTGIAIDNSGICYVTGSTDGALDGFSLTGNRDAFVIKYDALNGNKKETKLIGRNGGTIDNAAISVDKQGNYYITGSAYTNNDSKGFIYNNSYGIRFFGSEGKFVYSFGIILDSIGSCYVVGLTDDNLDGVNKIGEMDTFVSKYTTDLIRQSTRLISINKRTLGYGIGLDNVGRYYITGITGDYQSQTADVFIKKIIP